MNTNGAARLRRADHQVQPNEDDKEESALSCPGLQDETTSFG